MEFEGRILRVLPVRSGTSSKGEWKALPFVFEYFERPEDRWSDKVLLETMDPAIMGKIGAYVERGADGKGIVENGQMKLKSEIHCRCGFSHSVRDYTDKDGKTSYFNQVRIYKFELSGQVGQQPAPQAQAQDPFRAQSDVHQGEQGGTYDDLPF